MQAVQAIFLVEDTILYARKAKFYVALKFHIAVPCGIGIDVFNTK